MSAWYVVLTLCLLSLPISLLGLVSPTLRSKAKWAVIASTISIVVSHLSFGVMQKGVNPETVSLLVLMLCLLSLLISLVALVSRSLRSEAKWAAIASVVGLVVSFVSFGITHDVQRLSMTSSQNPDRAVGQGVEGRSEELAGAVKLSILEKKIILGMTPREARLAGGDCSYAVQADPQHWPLGSDPITVMARQAVNPDDSRITLTFRNATQFDSQTPVTFSVEIRRGRVSEIAAVGERT